MGEFNKRGQLNLREQRDRDRAIGASINAFQAEVMLTTEHDSSLAKKYRAALAHLARLQAANEVEFFLQVMELKTRQKLAEEAAIAEAHARAEKQEEINCIIDAENRKAQKDDLPIYKALATDPQLVQLLLTTIACYVTKVVAANQNIQAAQANQAVAQNNWQKVRQAFANNVADKLADLGKINPALKDIKFADVVLQAMKEQLSKRLLPMHAIEQQKDLQHIRKMVADEAENQLMELRKHPKHKHLNEESLHVLAKKNARDKMHRAEHCVLLNEILLAKYIKELPELVAKLVEEERKKHPDNWEKMNPAWAETKLRATAINNFIKELQGDLVSIIRSHDDEHIECSEKIKFNQNVVENVKEQLQAKLKHYGQFTDSSRFLDFVANLVENELSHFDDDVDETENKSCQLK